MKRRQAGTKIQPFVFLNETGGEKAAEGSFPSLPPAGRAPKISRDLYSHMPINTHACIYISP